MRVLSLFLASVFAFVSAACVIETTEDRPPTVSSTTPKTPSSGSTATATIDPVVVAIDTGKAMSAKGGDGVGVFVEYGGEGEWRVSYTCDSRRTSRSYCPFAITIESASKIDELAIDRWSRAEPSAPSSGASKGFRIDLSSVVGVEVGEYRFRTDAGARVTVGASIDGATDDNFLFFVHNGAVRGGYTGELSNPLTFEPTRP